MPKTKVAQESTDILSLAFRPRRLSDMVGQRATVEALRNQMAKRPPRAIMFSGPSRCGKTTMARIVAVSLQCPHQTQWGDPCAACYDMFDTFTIHEKNASEANGVEEIGKLVELAEYGPLVPSRKRVFILDEVHQVSKPAQNLLLKPTEDVPKHTVWIICTTEPNKIIPTLRNRFVAYRVKPLGSESRELLLKRAAKQAGITRPLQPLIGAVEEAGLDAPGLLLMALDKYSAGLEPAAAVVGTDASSVDTLAICRAVASSDWEGVKRAMAKASPEDARWIRASVAGYLRGMLMRERIPRKLERIAQRLTMLTSGTAPYEDAALLAWLWGQLCLICKRTEVHR